MLLGSGFSKKLLPKREPVLSPARHGPNILPRKLQAKTRIESNRSPEMATMNEMLSGCKGQVKWASEIFDKFSHEATEDLASIIHPSSYPAKMVLFSENEPSKHVFMVLDGEVKLSMNSSDGKRLILRIAKTGEVVGLTSAFTGNPYEMTAEALYPCVLACIERREYMDFLMRHPEAYQTSIEELGRQLTMACEQLRTVALSSSAPEKIARLLLDWRKDGPSTT